MSHAAIPNSESSSDNPDESLRNWIVDAQAGDQVALGKLLEHCRPYLLGIANSDIDSELRVKFAASDIVQETLIEAREGIQAFRGHSEAELLGWLRKILNHNVVDAGRYVRAGKRNIHREEGFGSVAPPELLQASDNGDSPSAMLSEQEEEMQLNGALQRMPDDYVQVIQLRNWDLMTFPQIANKMNRSEDAVRKLWVRAIGRLQHELKGSSDN